MSKSIDVLANEFCKENFVNPVIEMEVKQAFSAGYKQRSDELKNDRLFTLNEMIECWTDGRTASLTNANKYFKEKFNIDL